MRKLAIGLAGVFAILASPALARDGAIYVGGEVGLISVGGADIDIGADDNAVTVEHDYGFDVGLVAGYDLGAFRIEAEAAYKHAKLDSYQTDIRLPLEGPVFDTSERDIGGGSSSALSFMINGMLDFGDDDGISGFVGGGAGMAHVKASNYRNFANATPFLDGSDWQFAWQIVAGARQPISDTVDVSLRYRFFNVDNLRGVAFNGAETDYRFRSHSIMAGITFNFGGGSRGD